MQIRAIHTSHARQNIIDLLANRGPFKIVVIISDSGFFIAVPTRRQQTDIIAFAKIRPEGLIGLIAFRWRA